MLIPVHGLHGPNSKWADAQNATGRLNNSGASWLKLIFDEHYTTAVAFDARQARGKGVQVLVRTGQGPNETGNLMPDEAEVWAAIGEFGSLASAIEVGNEPPSDYRVSSMYHPTRWDHALRLEEIYDRTHVTAHNNGIILMPGGWSQNLNGSPQGPPTGTDSLSTRLREVYNQFDAIAVHLYATGDLTGDTTKMRLDAWSRCFPNKPIFITEYGIAYRWLDPNFPKYPALEEHHQLEKARRYANFIVMLQHEYPQVTAAFAFILGGTNDWRSFQGGGYDPNGQNSYWLSDDAWAKVGEYLLIERP